MDASAAAYLYLFTFFYQYVNFTAVRRWTELITAATVSESRSSLALAGISESKARQHKMLLLLIIQESRLH
jgi:hypothetical protein